MLAYIDSNGDSVPLGPNHVEQHRSATIFVDSDTGQALTEEEVDRYQLNPLWYPYVREQEVLAATASDAAQVAA